MALHPGVYGLHKLGRTGYLKKREYEVEGNMGIGMDLREVRGRSGGEHNRNTL